VQANSDPTRARRAPGVSRKPFGFNVLAARLPGHPSRRAPPGEQGENMSAESWQFAIETLTERPVQRAGLLLGFIQATGPVTIVLDLATDEFVRVPGLPQEPRSEALCIARDGSQIVVLSPNWGAGGALCLHTLATGHQTWYPNLPGEQTHASALAPDGSQIVTLSTTRDDVDDTDDEDDEYEDEDFSASVVNLIDLTTGQTQRLWWNAGGWSQESAISWSPDGKFVAATFLDMAEEFVSVVIDVAAGIEIARFDRALIPRGTNGAWQSARELIYTDDDYRIRVANIETGADTIRAQVLTPPIAVIGERYVQQSSTLPPGTGGLVSTRFDGEPNPFITIYSEAIVIIFDIATASNNT